MRLALSQSLGCEYIRNVNTKHLPDRLSDLGSHSWTNGFAETQSRVYAPKRV